MSNYKNLASTVLENSGQTTDTSITMPSTTAALFPTPPFYATIMPTNSGLANGSNSEIVEVTAATTSGANTIFSISRAQRGTSAISWDANEAILSHAIYTQDMPFIDDVLSTPSSVAYVATDNIQTSAVTTPKIADGAVTSDKIDWATHTYSTTEKVVGTDTDGKTIYERTWVASSVSFAAATNNSFNLVASTEPTVPKEIVDAFGHVAGIQYSGGPVIQYGLGAIRISSGSVTWATNVLFSSAGSLQLSVYSQIATPGSGYYRITVQYKY